MFCNADADADVNANADAEISYRKIHTLRNFTVEKWTFEKNNELAIGD